MAYHSGVEVYGTEYCFGGGNSGGSGITLQRPRAPPPGGSWVFYQTVEVAPLQKSRDEVQRIVTEIRAEFTAGSYDLVSRNCNDFSDAFCKRLCDQGIPSWVNALAGIGNSLGVGNLIRSAMGHGAASAGGKADVGAGGLASAGLMSGSLGVDGDLSGEIDWASAGVLNSSDDDAVSALRTGGLVASEQDSSAELLIFLPFRSQVKLLALHVSAPSADRAPRHVRLFANERNLDMSDAAGGVQPTADFAEVQWSAAGPDGMVTAALEVNFLKFQNLGFLAVHMCREDEEGLPEEGGLTICVRGLRLVGKS
eukprot:CAMPEP_0117475306 /NCGR_PEP_ID=MMETSP0784-20121206/9727_1 /TAXON_ID=39447 /ORGANISM="" /LENGTH=309 /DNA_ID=CAMNT_0005269549 /DNA_START=107 /DNA_END=1036 /DNA_ORIENTATION=-